MSKPDYIKLIEAILQYLQLFSNTSCITIDYNKKIIIVDKNCLGDDDIYKELMKKLAELLSDDFKIYTK